MTSAARALRRLADYGAWYARRSCAAAGPPRPAPAVAEVPQRLDEAGAKNWIAAYGVRLPQEKLVETAAQAVAFAEAIGGPVVLKVVSPDIAHKTEVGGVELGLSGAGEVAAGYARIMERVRAACPAARISGVLVSELLKDGVEMLLGFHQDPTFGPILTLGFGGVLVEVLRDVVHLRLPCSRDDIRAAMQRLAGRRVLDGVRGRPPADLEALLDAAESFAAFGCAQRGRVLDAEINPLIVRPVGHGAFAADALIHLKETRIN